MKNKGVFQLTARIRFSSPKLKFLCFSWDGHLNYCNSHFLLHGVLSKGSRQTGRPYI